jgi:hypothetical protein
MKVEKKVLARLEKCYSIAPLKYNGREHFLVAAEKVDRCILFDDDGNEEDTVWTEPGGVMSMVQVPGTNGQFLATQRFYSPNDGADAGIVVVTPQGRGNWQRRTLVQLPFVHRFDILERNGRRYLIACTIKSASEYKDDWRSPGKIYAADLPGDLSRFDTDSQLSLSVIKDGMLKNHGYYRCTGHNGTEYAVISSNEGIYTVVPPEQPGAAWTITQLSDIPSSDALLLDLDGDGKEELAVLSPFHGDTFLVLKESGGTYVPVYTCPEKMEFLHAVYGGQLCGKPRVVVGYRKGRRNLVAFSYDAATRSYAAEILDTDCGPANVFHYIHNGRDRIVSANRETDEIAMYTICD